MSQALLLAESVNSFKTLLNTPLRKVLEYIQASLSISNVFYLLLKYPVLLYLHFCLVYSSYSFIYYGDALVFAAS